MAGTARILLVLTVVVLLAHQPYAEDIKMAAAQQEGAPISARATEVRRLLSRTAAFRARAYETVTGMRDRHQASSLPDQIDEIVKGFSCLGDYRDAPAEAAKALALAREFRE